MYMAFFNYAASVGTNKYVVNLFDFACRQSIDPVHFWGAFDRVVAAYE